MFIIIKFSCGILSFFLSHVKKINIKVMLRTKTIRKLRRGSDSDEESLFGEDNLDGSLLSRTKSSPYRWREKVK